jgi:hypothetical protein
VQPETGTGIEAVPDDYDPFHRVRDMKTGEKELVAAADEKRHKIYTMNKRTDIQSEGKLSSKFVAAGSLCSNKFVRGGQEEQMKTLEQVF